MAACDETLVSMASEAAATALARSAVGADALGAVFAASVSDPYAEHGVAPHVAARHGATGVAQVAEIHEQLVGAAGDVQVDDPTVGLQHSIGIDRNATGSVSCVNLLERV